MPDPIVVDTEYDSCACSPLGKVKRVSQPYAPGGTVYWTTYTYDGLGRTTRIDLPNGGYTTFLLPETLPPQQTHQANGKSILTILRKIDQGSDGALPHGLQLRDTADYVCDILGRLKT
ncbi:MAG: hypothetical protein U0V70_15575 [Terriglobia bacterium]